MIGVRLIGDRAEVVMVVIDVVLVFTCGFVIGVALCCLALRSL